MSQPTQNNISDVDEFFAKKGRLSQQAIAKTTSKTTSHSSRKVVNEFFSAMNVLSHQKPPGPTTCETHGYSLDKFFKDANTASGELDEIASILVKSTKHLESKRGWFTEEADEAMQQGISEIGTDLIKILSGWSKQDVGKHYQDRDKFKVMKGFHGGRVVGALIAQKMEREDLARFEEKLKKTVAGDQSSDYGSPIETAKKGPPSRNEEGYDDKLANWAMNWDITEKVLYADRKGLIERANDAPFWLVETMGVLPEARGMRVGQAMLGEVQSQATKDNIAVTVIADYEAVGFYTKCGFDKVGEIHYHLPKYQPSTMMRWLPDALREK
ncbi:hypothetical protein F5B20DRAFT_586395 [Whalleya microplaca]|nr:hypothetical protein F5B20DRAFT_586395 [Whalleya microplaca]